MRRFAVFTHVTHQRNKDSYYAYGPYVREMNIWFKNVDEVEVVAPAPLPLAIRTKKERNVSSLFYEQPNLTFTTIPSFDFLKMGSAFIAVFAIPNIIFRIIGAMRRADHLHLRCPGNIGLLACFCQVFFPNKPKTAKYAGNWDPNSKQPWSYRLQMWILSNTFLTRNMTVLVYGDWPNQSENVVPFFTASFSEKDKQVINKEIRTLYKFLFVGNLIPGKHPEVAIQIVENLNKRNIRAELHFYGDGELMSLLLDREKNKDYIHLHGNHPLEVLKQAYKDSHFLILASKSEGWPKAVAEAMFFGCIPVVTNVSCVSWMINYGSRGILIPEVRVESGKWKEDRFKEESGERREDSQEVVEDTVDRIIELISKKEEMKRMSLEAQEWSQQYTLEKFEDAIKEILANSKAKD